MLDVTKSYVSPNTQYGLTNHQKLTFFDNITFQKYKKPVIQVQRFFDDYLENNNNSYIKLRRSNFVR